MSTVYLKTIFSTDSEYPFVTLNLLESYDYVDCFLVCEANRTHTGLPRDYIFDIEKIPSSKRHKIKHIKMDVSKHTVVSPDDEQKCHAINEKYIRGSFVQEVSLKDDDIIFSVDADEIIYGHLYPELLDVVRKEQVIQLQLHQFFYKMNYYWVNNKFRAPIGVRAARYKNIFPLDWRYDGSIYPVTAGCHFSWCMPVEELLLKMQNYAHAAAVSHLASKEILKNAIENKVYPFDLTRKFVIQELDYDKDSHLYPQSFLDNRDIFSREVL